MHRAQRGSRFGAFGCTVKDSVYAEAIFTITDSRLGTTFALATVMLPLHVQISWLFVLAIPVSCIAWTVTHEEVFREFNEFCKNQCKKGVILKRKFFFLFTCEFCFSHYVTILFLIITKFQLLFNDWRGYIISGFSIVWIANCYMSIYAWLRTSLKKERIEATIKEKDAAMQQNDVTPL